MLTIDIPVGAEMWDEKNECFVEPQIKTLQLEHSLVSLSKWESRWHKPFLTKEQKSVGETIDYIKCMTITKNVPDSLYTNLNMDMVDKVNDYISNPMTATTINKKPGTSINREIVTNELIYYWMITLQIPFECEKWHLNRLLTLIDVCNIKNSKPQKMSKKDVMARNAKLNAERRAKLHSKG